MYHIPILLFWDQDIATSPRTLPETANDQYYCAIDILRYLSFTHIMLLNLLSDRTLSRIFPSYFEKVRLIEKGER